MTAKYIFRLDDICENMNWNNYSRVKSIFLENDVKPIIGVIPNNRDEEFLKYPKYSHDFWDEVKRLQCIEGWSIALHGYTHVYETENSGILNINNRSEFAGLSKKNQNEKIIKGMQVFKDKEIKIDAFMAPAHSFDKITMQCLKENGIHVITDGYSLFPYYEDDILFVPQLFSRPRKMPFGLYTWCLHTNSMSDKEIDGIEVFIKENRGNIITFSEADKYIINNINYRIQSFFLKNLISIGRRLRK